MSKAIFEYSAGGVVVDRDRVLLIQTTDQKGNSVWTFPKGQLEAGEHSPETAVREVQEETGYQCDIVCGLPKSTYWFRHKDHLVHKTVRWFLMRPLQRRADHDFEVEQVVWYSFSEAQQRLTYASDKKLLKAAWHSVSASREETTS
jgi:8-oxo-dGTP diphosphatase